MTLLVAISYLLIPSCILIHLLIAPYTKVEESFNIQAIHDILVHGIPNENAAQFFDANYDHVSFPGSVPRTFTGALLLSGLSRPWIWLVHSSSQMQLLVRAILGLLNASALIWYGKSIQRTFGRGAGVWYALFQASQFHVIYYASRTLPNTFAFGLLDAHVYQFSRADVSKIYRLSLYLLTFAGVVFRSELAILVATLTLYLLASRNVSITKTIIPAGIGGLLIGLCCTISIDSFFWQTMPIWPEWTGFYYNTIQGHSANWGTSPWHYYILNAIPRLMLNPVTYLLCIPVAVINPITRTRSLDLLVPLVSFIVVYSFLPHKEWRFIIYAIPGFTGVAAAGASWITTRSSKSICFKILSLILLASLIFSFFTSSVLLVLSSLNYPGGEALTFLHRHILHPEGRQLGVYLDNLACQTGVTRFLEVHDGVQTVTDVLEADSTARKRSWRYSKTEDPQILLDPKFWAKFDYVLAERPEKVIGNWEIIHVVYGFSGIRILKPGEHSDQEFIEHMNFAGWNGHKRDKLINRIARLWKALENLVRYPILRGWWVEVNMQPKIHILANGLVSS